MIRLITIILLFMPHLCLSAYLYVDPGSVESDATWSGVNGESYTSTDPDFPGAGAGYSTVQAAVTAMSGGDDLYLRGGEYDNAQLTGGSTNTVTISDTVDGTAENYTSIQSFPGEWAILDGENDCDDYGGGRARGLLSSGTSGAGTTDYLLIERLEIKRGANTGGTWAAGLCVGGAGLKIRYCYIHDNTATDSNNPSGIRGYGWSDVTVEYNLFEDNGVADADGPSYSGDNCNHVTPFSAYDSSTVADEGYTDATGVRNVTVQYNYFLNGGASYKVKGHQFFTSRRSGDFVTTYASYGTLMHHNIIEGAYSAGIKVKSDFATIYNNIINDSKGGIKVGFDKKMQGVVLYNNTIIDNQTSSIGNTAIYRYGNSGAYAYESTEWHTYDYNNIVSEGNDVSGEYSGTNTEWHIGRNPSSDSSSTSNLNVQRLYVYDGDDTDILSISWDTNNTLYTESSWETAFSSSTIYSGSGGSPTLFQDTTGAEQYKINSTHIVEGAVEAGTTGVGGSHPYRSMTIPSYIGAANPNDNGWVDGVLALDVTYFTNAEAGSDPTWIEGANPPTHTGIQLQGVSIQ